MRQNRNVNFFNSRNLSNNFTSPNRRIAAARSAVLSDSNLLKTNYGLSGLAPIVSVA